MAITQTSSSRDGLVYQPPGKPNEAILYDFEIEGATPKPAHFRWLDQWVIHPAKVSTKLTSGLWYVWLYGNASPTGSIAYNADLSSRRALAIYNYVEKQLSGTPHVTSMVPLGESRAAADGLPDEIELDFYRSVSVVAGFYTKKPPVPPPPPPPPRRRKEPSAPRLQIRVTNVFVMQRGFGIGILDITTSLLIVHFEIRDNEKCEVGRYRLTQPLADVSLGSGLPIPNLPEYMMWSRATAWKTFASAKASDHAGSFDGFGRVLEVDRSSLVMRLSRDSMVALKGVEFTFSNPDAPTGKMILQPLPGIPVATLIGGTVSLSGKVQPCKP